jgi:Peptidoglycan-binding protein, CsiV
MRVMEVYRRVPSPRTASIARAVLWLLTLPAWLIAPPGAAAAEEPASAPTAASPVYNIEIIVFRAAAALGGAEDWSAEADTTRSIAGDESAGGATQVGHFVAALPSSVWQLTDLENRLRASGSYVPVAHTAWSQTASSWGTRAGFPIQRLGVDVPGLSGSVFLERGQYLHLGLSLTYAMPSPPPALGAAPGTPFTINESRRVRFYERNYFDHPAFGVIALVTPAQGARPPGR